jgi:hypothetical protein
MTKWGTNGCSLKKPPRTSWLCPPFIKVVWLLESRWRGFIHRHAEMQFQLDIYISLWRETI